MAMRDIHISTGLIVFFLMSFAALASCQDILPRGSSISTQDDTTTILVSPNRAFSCGFYKVATNAFTFSIWFSWSFNKTVAWTANRDTPVNGEGSKLTFKKNGGLELIDHNGTAVWSTNTASTPADRAMLLDNGNLVVMDPQGQILWRSFDSPTDTLLPWQPMTRNTKLVSASARGLLYSGLYTFYFDSNNILTLIYNGPETSSIYWPNPDNSLWGNGRTTYNSSQYGVLDQKGQFVASDQFEFQASDFGVEVVRRLTLDYDGNLRLYSLNTIDGSWSVSWIALSRNCDIHGVCGKNRLCTYEPNLECSCLEGFDMTEPSDWSKGCNRKTNTKTNQNFSFKKIPGIDFWGYDFNYTSLVPLWECTKICLDNVYCQAFSYRTGTGECLSKTLLIYGKDFADPCTDLYLKVPDVVSSSAGSPSRGTHVCNVSEIDAPSPSPETFKSGYFLTSALTLLVVEVTLIVVGFCVVHNWQKRQEAMDEGSIIISNQFRRFSYKELQKATNYFKEELGVGGSGVVYKGVLNDERKVAVKKLNDVIQGEQEFRSELSVIGRIYHMNVVRTWGFCAEKTQRILVSEFVENGSLDRVLFEFPNSSHVLQWNQRYNIAIGVAKGLAYLHHECLEWVVHCDIKPENILLDEDFKPKIADFGLVKLLGRGLGAKSLSKVHGTRGYIAPEWALNLPISGKADVYSYGVILLELVMGTRVSCQVVDMKWQQHILKAASARLERVTMEIFAQHGWKFSNRISC